MKPIQQTFKLAQAALCLANEWRDTISYTLGSALTVAELAQGHSVWAPIFLTAVFARELLRTISWTRFPYQLSLAGHKSPVIDNIRNAAAAGIVANGAAFGFLGALMIYYHSLGALGGVPFLLTSSMNFYSQLLLRGSETRDIPKIYFDKETGMWDWPRKNKGDGPTQTQKLKDGIKNAASVVGERLGGLAPRPAPIPVSVPVRARRMVMPR